MTPVPQSSAPISARSSARTVVPAPLTRISMPPRPGYASAIGRRRRDPRHRAHRPPMAVRPVISARPPRPSKRCGRESRLAHPPQRKRGQVAAPIPSAAGNERDFSGEHLRSSLYSIISVSAVKWRVQNLVARRPESGGPEPALRQRKKSPPQFRLGRACSRGPFSPRTRSVGIPRLEMSKPRP